MQSITNVIKFTPINVVSVSVILHHQSFILNITQWSQCCEDGKNGSPTLALPLERPLAWGSEHELDRFLG